MSKFVLDTDSVIASSDVISKAAKKFSNAEDYTNGWNTENEDGFDFASAKSVIVNNLGECSKKALNTVEILNVVIDSHNYLQSSIVFDESAASMAAEKSSSAIDSSLFKFADDKKVVSSPDTSVDKNLDGDSSSVVSAAQVVSTSTTSSSGMTPRVSSSHTKSSAVHTKSTTSKSTKVVAKHENSELGKVVNTKEKVDVKPAKSEVFEQVDTTHPINLDTKVVSVDGYSMVGSRFVVRCDSEIAKTGDVLKFKSADGNSMECIVGSNVDVIGNVDKIGLITDSDNKIVDTELTHFLNDGSTAIENLGNYKSVSLTEGGDLLDA